MRYLILVFGLLSCLWVKGQDTLYYGTGNDLVIYNYEYIMKDYQLHLRVSYSYFVVGPDAPHVFSGTIKTCEYTGLGIEDELNCTYKFLKFPLTPGIQNVLFVDEVPIDCDVPYIAALCNLCKIMDDPNAMCVGACYGGCCTNGNPVQFIPPFECDIYNIYDTIPIYDTIQVRDTIHVLDTIPIYLVYENTTGMDLHDWKIMVTNNEINVNFNPVEIKIYNLTGMLLKNSSEKTISLKGLSPGVFILEIIFQDKRSFRTKFMKN